MENVEQMSVLAQALIGLGGPGIMVFIMVYFFNKQGQDHKSEREEWREDAKSSHTESIDALRENTEALRDLGDKVAGKKCHYNPTP